MKTLLIVASGIFEGYSVSLGLTKTALYTRVNVTALLLTIQVDRYIQRYDRDIARMEADLKGYVSSTSDDENKENVSKSLYLLKNFMQYCLREQLLCFHDSWTFIIDIMGWLFYFVSITHFGPFKFSR